MLLSLILKFIFVYEYNLRTGVSAHEYITIGTRVALSTSTSYHVNISCQGAEVINITNIKVWSPSAEIGSCKEKEIGCNLTVHEKAKISSVCNNTNACAIDVEFESKCANDQELSNYDAFDKSNTDIVTCHPCNDTFKICHSNQPPLLKFYPEKVNFCLNELNINETFGSLFNLHCKGHPKENIDVSPWNVSYQSCLQIQPQMQIVYTCQQESKATFTSNPVVTHLLSSTTETLDSTVKHLTEAFPHTPTQDFMDSGKQTTEALYHTSTRDTTVTGQNDGNVYLESNKEKEGNNVAVIAVVVGGIAFLIAFAFGILYVYRKRFEIRKRREQSQNKHCNKQNSQEEYAFVANVAYGIHNGIRAPIKLVENSTYQEIFVDSSCSNEVNQNSRKTSSEHSRFHLKSKALTPDKTQPQPVNNATISLSKKKDYISNNHTYLDLPNGPFNSVNYAEVKRPKKDTRNGVRNNDSYDNAHDLPLFGYSKSGDTKPYSLRKDCAYDTTHINAQTIDDSYSGNHYDLRMSGTYDTSQAQNKPRTRESDDDVNHYDLRISGTYDTSQALSKPRVREVYDDVNPYDIRVSGAYDSASNVAGGRKNCDDISENTYDHFFGKKNDGNYDEVTTRSAKPTSSIYGQK